MTILFSILFATWAILKTWWWVFIPFLLWKPFVFLWLWWRRENWSKTQKYIILEVRMPREIERPYRAMEQVFAGFWMLYDPPDWWEKWIEGHFQMALSLEIVSIGGQIHFLIRVPESSKNLIESSIYSQYPDVEISEVEDYTKLVPQDIPNDKWDLWGCDYELMKPDIYPIKTYSKFFETKVDTPEEKRIDPLAALLEGMSKIKKEEQMWIQVRLSPVTNADNNYKDRAKEVINKLAKRPAPPKKRPIIEQAAEVLITGKPPEEKKKEEAVFPPEMNLTPGEIEVLREVENKISKTMFECYIRFVFLGEREVFYKPTLKTVLAFFANFNTENLNSLKPWGPSITKVHKHEHLFTNILFYDSLLYIKKRRIFRDYLARLNYFFPKPGKTFVLNIEELATMFHFVGRRESPAPLVQRIEAKKGEPPSSLPTS